MTTKGLRLEALDVLFFRDGRPFSAATRAASGLPTPQVLAGALRTALLEKYGCPFDRLATAFRQLGRDATFARAIAQSWPSHTWIGQVLFRGPWFSRRFGEGYDNVEALVPMPATLHQVKKKPLGQEDKLKCLRPLPTEQLPGWRSDAQACPRPLGLSGSEATEPAAGFLTREGQQAFLDGNPVLGKHLVPSSSLFALDHRTGIRIQPDRLAAAEGEIYSISFLALNNGIKQRHEVGLYAEVVLPPEAPDDVLSGVAFLALGGEGRRARLIVLPKTYSWPVAAATGPEKAFLLLTTPGLFAERWRPRELSGLLAAAVPAALAVSGWDLTRNGPKPTRFAAPAASVYFLDGPANDLGSSLADMDEDRRQGWGCYLKGVWTE